jgi:hypothetical protein
MKKLSAFLVCVALVGCAPLTVSMMPRDGGTIYKGVLQPSGDGVGSMTVAMAGQSCQGPAARVASSESFGFSSAFASDSRGRSATASGISVQDGDVRVKAILSCDGGGGLRCEITGRNGNGGGICVDDKNRVFDVLISRQ